MSSISGTTFQELIGPNSRYSSCSNSRTVVFIVLLSLLGYEVLLAEETAECSYFLSTIQILSYYAACCHTCSPCHTNVSQNVCNKMVYKARILIDNQKIGLILRKLGKKSFKDGTIIKSEQKSLFWFIIGALLLNCRIDEKLYGLCFCIPSHLVTPA